MFADDRYDAVWVEQPEKVVEFLADRGFRKLNAEEIGKWMAEKVNNQTAYGTVCVFPSGMLPDSVLGPETVKALEQNSTDKSGYRQVLLRKYMEAGGRAVWMGDQTLDRHQGPTADSKAFPRAQNYWPISPPTKGSTTGRSATDR